MEEDKWFLEILYSLNEKTNNQKALIIAENILELENRQKQALKTIQEATSFLLNANSPEGMDANDIEIKENYELAQKELSEVQIKIEKLNNFYLELLS